MKIAMNQVVSISYELTVDGNVMETVTSENPLTFLFGAGNLLPMFESHLDGLVVNDQFEFQIASDDAYGPYNEEAVVSVPMKAFEVDGKVDKDLLQKGNTIPMLDTSGRRMNGIVVEKNIESVKMDFNHPLAGNDLNFKGKVVDIRKATTDEIQHGHIHSAEDCHDCDNPECRQ
jgi:FKBP-type peptidyl-prolyl cis-trans isomerase SlyD